MTLSPILPSASMSFKNALQDGTIKPGNYPLKYYRKTTPFKQKFRKSGDQSSDCLQNVANG